MATRLLASGRANAAILALAAMLVSSCSTPSLSPTGAPPASQPPQTSLPTPTTIPATLMPSPVALWRPTASLAGAREAHTATLLRDGGVLVVGGWQAYVPPDASGARRALDSVELFDPTTDTWAAGPPLHHDRAEHRAILLADGRVLVIGGRTVGIETLSEQVRRPEIFDPANGTWSDIDNPPMSSVLDAIRLTDGRVLAVGFGTGSDSMVERLAMWNPNTSRWRRLADAPVARFRPSLTLLGDGLLLVAGGSVPNTPEPSPQPEAWLYDPATDDWDSIEPMHEGRFAHSSALLADGRVLIVGQVTAEIFDPTTGHWALTVAQAGDRLGAAAVPLADGRVLVVGSPGACTGTETLAEIYDPAAAEWSGAGSVDHIAELTATRLLDGRVLVAGGGRPCGSTEDDYGPFADALLFDPSSVR